MDSDHQTRHDAPSELSQLRCTCWRCPWKALVLCALGSALLLAGWLILSTQMNKSMQDGNAIGTTSVPLLNGRPISIAEFRTQSRGILVGMDSAQVADLFPDPLRTKSGLRTDQGFLDTYEFAYSVSNPGVLISLNGMPDGEAVMQYAREHLFVYFDQNRSVVKVERRVYPAPASGMGPYHVDIDLRHNTVTRE